MNVGVRAGQRIPTMLTRAARPQAWSTTHEPLSEPQRKSLLADADRAVEEQRARHRITPDRLLEAGTNCCMAMQREERHGLKLFPRPVAWKTTTDGARGHSS